MTRAILTAALLVLANASSLAAQRTTDSAAFLFGYRIKAGQTAAFAEGYRKHLEWHREHGDSLSWLGWFVLDGPDAGMFVDGTFGKPFAAADARVDPAGDAADAARTVAPYGDLALREVYRLRGDLSTASALEAGKPGAAQQVMRLRVAPGRREQFETAARSVVKRPAAEYSLYELTSGGEEGTYLLIAQLAGYRSLTDRSAVRRLLDAAGASIVRAESAVWMYRADLSVIVK
jgi:hypothetical protein